MLRTRVPSGRGNVRWCVFRIYSRSITPSSSHSCISPVSHVMTSLLRWKLTWISSFATSGNSNFATMARPSVDSRKSDLWSKLISSTCVECKIRSSHWLVPLCWFGRRYVGRCDERYWHWRMLGSQHFLNFFQRLHLGSFLRHLFLFLLANSAPQEIKGLSVLWGFNIFNGRATNIWMSVKAPSGGSGWTERLQLWGVLVWWIIDTSYWRGDRGWNDHVFLSIRCICRH